MISLRGTTLFFAALGAAGPARAETLELELSTAVLTSPSTAAPAAVAPDAPAVPTSSLPAAPLGDPLPRWLARAEKYYEDGIHAQAAGNDRRARRYFGSALKLMAKNSDEETVAVLKDQMAALFARIEDQLFSPTEEDVPARGLDVPEEDLRRVRPAEIPREVKEHDYAIHVDPEDPLVKKYLASYTGSMRGRFQEALDRMAVYRSLVLKEIAAAGLPLELLYLPLVESEYQQFAVSPAGAVGLWQFMPQTAQYAGLKVNYWMDERRDPERATPAALKTLKGLYQWFDDWHLALAAYNRGLYGVQKDLEFTRSADFSQLAKRQGLPRETEHYVPKLMACILIADNLRAYGFRLKPDSPPPALDTVFLDRPLDLKVAAHALGVAEEDVRRWNPALRLWCTPKNDSRYGFRLPAGRKEKFAADIARVKDWTPTPDVIRYRVRPGDVLGKIALRYRTTVAVIMRDNTIRSPRSLRPKQTLIIRPGRGYRGE
jgi:membrane-bound lytic murein transglycosylase D